MELFECDSCLQKWSLEKVAFFVKDSGFINLTNNFDEIIAFNCPDKSCSGMVVKHYPPRKSIEFHNNITRELDPSGYFPVDFRCFSSLPFSSDSCNILKAFETSESLAREEDVRNPDLWDSTIAHQWHNYYDSLNYEIPSLMSQQVRVFHYKKDDADRLLHREAASRKWLFPRYLPNNPLFIFLDSLVSEYYSGVESLIDHILSDKNYYPREREQGAEHINVSPTVFFGLLSIGPQNEPDPMFSGKEIMQAFENKQSRHQQMIQNLSSPFKKGDLNEFLMVLGEEFILKYMRLFPSIPLQPNILWDFKEEYLQLVHEKWESGFFDRKNFDDIEYGFFQEGESWVIYYQGESSGLVKGKGFRYIYHLICRQGCDVSVLDLLDLFAKSSEPSHTNTVSPDEYDNYRGIDGARYQDILDVQALTSLRRRLKELARDRKEATDQEDHVGLKIIDKEIEDIKRELSKSTGLAGKSREFKNATKQQQNTVGREIQRCIDKLENEELAQHLDEAINPKRSTMIKYNPPEKIEWVTVRP